MKELRKVDDNIINRLNSTSVQAEGVCGDFFRQMSAAYAQRDEAIDYCLKVKKKKTWLFFFFNLATDIYIKY
jgi:hypothetical protein